MVRAMSVGQHIPKIREWEGTLWVILPRAFVYTAVDSNKWLSGTLVAIISTPLTLNPYICFNCPLFISDPGNPTATAGPVGLAGFRGLGIM